MRRLVPDPGPTSIAEQLDGYRPWDDPPADRPYLALNFATTLDGRASIDGRSGPIGSDTDTAMLVGLRAALRRGDDRRRDDAGRALRADHLRPREARAPRVGSACPPTR